ncbi:MAG: hypothetical protein CM15mP32_0010 [Flavobacteriaceae bacterium]|nr:MAG: hypothetical protein CM15mP32_0010 [Flavobacteriaceae bacterium]
MADLKDFAEQLSQPHVKEVNELAEILKEDMALSLPLLQLQLLVALLQVVTLVVRKSQNLT